MPNVREGESTRGGGGGGSDVCSPPPPPPPPPPRENILNFERFYVRFNEGFMRFSRFGHDLLLLGIISSLFCFPYYFMSF